MSKPDPLAGRMPGQDAPPPVVPETRRGWFTLSPLNQRRWRNFRRNGRAYWSLMIFLVLFGLSLFAEFIANDKPFLVKYRGDLYFPVFQFYPETTFGGDFRTEAIYRDPEVKCLIETGGLDLCFDDPEGYFEDAQDGVVEGETIEKGWALWPIIPYSYDTPVERPGAAPLAPNVIGSYTDDAGESHWGLLPPEDRGANLLAPMTPSATCWRGRFMASDCRSCSR